jgi:MerR family copper efflux transcriptional regulator
MDGSTISEAAEKTGFTPSALRYYEDHGLVQPDRSAAGYRLYDERDVERLRFIGRAKGFGLTLEEITDVLQLLDDDVCGPVQDRLRSLVAAKIVGAQEHIAELVAFTAELQRVSHTLDVPSPAGPCSDSCGCLADHPGVEPTEATSVALIGKPDAGAATARPIACALAPAEVPERMAGWQAVLATVEQREPLPDGVRLHIQRGTDAAALVELAAAEQTCCTFFTFRLTLDATGTSLDVTGPTEARPVIESFVGVAA